MGALGRRRLPSTITSQDVGPTFAIRGQKPHYLAIRAESFYHKSPVDGRFQSCGKSSGLCRQRLHGRMVSLTAETEAGGGRPLRP